MIKRIAIITGSTVIVIILALSATGKPRSESSTENWRKLIGSWQVTIAQTSLIVSIEPDHKVLVLWIRKGSHSMLRTSWKPFHGGILVQGVPRIRLWTGRENNNNELRAELEAIPELGYDPNKEFHDHFFMRRIKYKEPQPQLLNRPVPEQWTQETLGEDWNTSAGREPLSRNKKKKDETAK